jgi:DNA-binding MarR family transcriptional regulator
MTRSWGFLTNHALVLIYVTRHHDSTVREISAGVGVTERATLAILRELDEDRIVERHRAGRRNTYAVNFAQLAAYRRRGTAPLTPREFVDGLVTTLLTIARTTANATSTAPKAGGVDSGALEPQMGRWGFLTNHALLLLSIALDRESTVREMAASVGVTERAIVALLNQLEDESVIGRTRNGRRNEYTINYEALRTFPRWSPGDWKIPPELIDVAVKGLRALAAPAR